MLKHHPDCRFTTNHKGLCFGKEGTFQGWPKDEDCKHNSRRYPPVGKDHTGPIIWYCNDCGGTNEPQVDGPTLETLGEYMENFREGHQVDHSVEERLDTYKDLLMNIVLESNKLVAKLSKHWKEGDGANLMDMLQVATDMLDADAEAEDDDFIVSEMEGDDETSEIVLTPSGQENMPLVLGECDNMTHLTDPHEFSQTCRNWRRIYPKVWRRIYPKVIPLPASTAKRGFCMNVDCPPVAHIETRRCTGFVEKDDVRVSEVEQKRRKVTTLNGFIWEPDEAVEFSPEKDHVYETQ